VRGFPRAGPRLRRANADGLPFPRRLWAALGAAPTLPRTVFADPAPVEERCRVAILFPDLSGSTARTTGRATVSYRRVSDCLDGPGRIAGESLEAVRARAALGLALAAPGPYGGASSLFQAARELETGTRPDSLLATALSA